MEPKTVYMVRFKTFKNGKTTKPQIYEKENDVHFQEKMKKVYPGITRKVFQTKEEAKVFVKELEIANTKMVPELPKVSPEIKKIVAELFEIQKSKVLEDLQDRYKRAIERLKTVEGMDHNSKEWQEVEFLKQSRFGKERTFCGTIYFYLMDINRESYSNNWSYNFKLDYKKIVENMIQKDLYSIMSSFLYKMEMKLGEVIKTKEIKEFVSIGLHDGYVRFIFKDGTNFHMENSIEWGVSKLGKPFQRFPCRFHDVTFSNGVFIKWVSEDQMKKDF